MQRLIEAVQPPEVVSGLGRDLGIEVGLDVRRPAWGEVENQESQNGDAEQGEDKLPGPAQQERCHAAIVPEPHAPRNG